MTESLFISCPTQAQFHQSLTPLSHAIIRKHQDTETKKLTEDQQAKPEDKLFGHGGKNCNLNTWDVKAEGGSKFKASPSQTRKYPHNNN